MKRILISTGGSGGHVIPALNLYDHLKNDFHVKIYTDARGAKYIPKNIIKKIFDVKQVPEKFYFFPFKLIFLFIAFVKSIIHLSFNKFDIIISFGGYMSLPIVLAAKTFNIKIFLIEPNSIIGRSNKFLLKFSSNMLSYDNDISNNSDKSLNSKKRIIPAHKNVTIDPLLNRCFYQKINLKESKNKYFKILIIGGSQASLFFSQILKNEIIDISTKHKIEVTQQLSPGYDVENYKKEYDKNNIKNNLFYFENNFLCKENDFDIAITRAGASTLTELAYFHIPFVAIPFPHATDNHQFWNAKRYHNLNCCWILEEKNFISGDMYKLISRIISNKEEYNIKKNNLKKYNEKKTWENINNKFIRYFNDN